MKISVLVPVCNEIKTIGAVIKQLQALPIDKEIILVDDFSTDGTRQFLKSKFGEGRDNLIVFYHDKNLGKGTAVRTALKHAKGDYTVIQDADLEYNPQDYLKLVEHANKNKADVVYGSRFYNSWKSTTLFHFFVNKFLTILTNILYGSNLTDMETCYKLIKTDIFKSLDLKSRRFEIEPEITVKLLKNGYKICEVPISYKGRSYHEGKKIGWLDGIMAVWILFKLWFCNCWLFYKSKRQ